jgi:hypothetical protein
MSKTRVLCLISIGAVLLAFSSFTNSTEPVGPFDVKLEISHLPRLNEEVALICSVTSPRDLDSVEVGFRWSDTTIVKLIRGQKKYYCKFKKDETKVFELTVTFPAEGVFWVMGYAKAYFGKSGVSGILSNVAPLCIKTYKDGTAVLLERMPWRLPDYALPRLPPAVRDSIKASACSLRVRQR